METGITEAVLQCFQRDHGVLDMDDVRARVSANPNTIRGTIVRLCKQGKIKKVGRARYMLTRTDAAATAQR